MTEAELLAWQARIENQLADLQQRVDNLQQQVDNRTAFNNGLAFKLNKVLFDLKRLTERGENQSAS